MEFTESVRYDALIRDVLVEKRELYDRFPHDYWRERNFDVIKALNSSKGPLVEVAGPTQGGYRLVDLAKLNRRLTVSNTKAQESPDTINLQAGAFAFPFADHSISGLFFLLFP